MHFIQAVKNGIVKKILHIDSRGGPGLAFKALKGIYDSVDANRRLEERYDNMKFESDMVKVRRSCSDVEKKSKKRGIDSKKLDIKTENEEESDLDDINFGKITLKQLKKQNKVKRRKTTHVHSVTVKEEFADSPIEKDETGLNETINSLKSNKPKGRKRSPKEYAQPSTSVKSVKVEVSETKYSEPMFTIPEACDSSVSCSEPIEDVENDFQPENHLSLTEKRERCDVNGICYDHLKDIEDGIIECSEMTLPQSPDSDEETATWISVPEEGYLETTISGQSLDLHTNKIYGVEEPAIITESTELSDLNNENTPLDLKFDSSSSPKKNYTASRVFADCTNCEVNLFCEEKDLFSSRDLAAISVSTGTEREYSPDESSVVLREVSATDEENQILRDLLDNAKSDSTDLNEHCDSVFEDSVSEMGNRNLVGIWHPPERLLSTRKGISPISQQKLCQAMRGVESIDDEDHYNSKGKLQFENATENEPSTKGQGTEITILDTNTEQFGALERSKVNMKPKRNTIKKSSPKTHSIPNFSTGTRSIQKLAESAIAFSQRQMHDFESLATKLMLELNSMEDIVEQKLHPETSLMSKNDVDEVRLVVKSAKKSEEITRKWFSMMARDCNRFCTIMKLSEKGEVPSPDKSNKERRKISFADEAGGVLCHVKVELQNMTNLESMLN